MDRPTVHLIDAHQSQDCDSHVPVFPKMRKDSFDLCGTPLAPAILEEQDCVVLATTDHAFDYALIQKYSRMIVDARGAYQQSHANVVEA